MKIIILSILSIAIFSSCSKTGTRFEIDPALAPYYGAFVQSGKDRNQQVSTDDLTMGFADLGTVTGSPAGQCKTGITTTGSFFTGETTYSTPQVIINSAMWNRLDEYSRRNLIYHELGHCLLHRGHTEEINEFHYVRSLMYPRIIAPMLDFLYPRVEQNYFDELFNPAAPAMDPWTGLLSQHKIEAKKSFLSVEELKNKTFTTSIDGKCKELTHDHSNDNEGKTNE